MNTPERSSEKESRLGKPFIYNQLARDNVCKVFLELQNETIFFKFASYKNTVYCQCLDNIDRDPYSILEQTTYDDTSEPPLEPQDISRLSTYIRLLFNSVEQKWLQDTEPGLEKRYIYTIVISGGKIVKIVREKCVKKSKKRASTRIAKKIDTVLSNISLDINLDEPS